MARRSIGVVLSVAFGSLFAVGCASSGEDTESGDGALTPCNNPAAPQGSCPETVEQQRPICAQREAENGAFRDQDLDTGVVRWKCGDVTGVTNIDLGQEYCEFHAMQAGTIVDTAPRSEVKADQVECLFTAVYNDVKDDRGGPQTIAFGNKLNKALTEEPGNLKNAKGVTLPMALAAQDRDDKVIKPGPNPLSVMNGLFNARGAAVDLVQQCGDLAKQDANAKRINAADDSLKCKADGSGCVSARDVEACTLVTEAGAGWRNSDPIICSRAARGALCGADYSDAGTKFAKLDGFIMTDWKADLAQAVKLWTGASSEAPTPPQACRYATVDGKPYLHMMICTPSAAQVNNPKYEGRLEQMCSDTFGPSIAMTAPIGLVAKLGTDQPGFCAEFNKGAEALVSVASTN
jgi:hypothetical protein